MMRTFTFGMLGIFCALLSPSLPAAELQEYRLYRYAKTAEHCESERVRISEVFDRFGTAVYHSQCEPSGKYFTLRITYISEKALSLVSTIDRGYYLSMAAYKTEELCQKDLERELGHFRQQTRLDPFVAYCAPQSELSQFPHFLIRIEALGTPLTSPHSFSRMVMPRVSDQQALINELEAAKSDRLAISRVRFPTHLGGHEISFHYYAKERVCLGLELLMAFEEADACVRYSSALKTMVQASAEPPLGIICGTRSPGAEAWLLTPRDKVLVESETAPQKFLSQGDCEAGKAAILEFYKTTLKRQVLGGLCHNKKDGKAVLSVVSERPAPKECF